MEEFLSLIDIAQAGLSAVLLTILFALWREQKEQNKYIRDLLAYMLDKQDTAAAERQHMISKLSGDE